MRKVRRVLITISLLAFLSSLGGCLTYNVREESKRNEYYQKQSENRLMGLPTFSGPYCYPDPHPQLLARVVILSALVLFLLVMFRNSLWATPAALTSFAMYPFWFWKTQRELAMAESYHAIGIDSFFLHAGLLDITAAFLTSLLGFTLIALNITALAIVFLRRKLP